MYLNRFKNKEVFIWAGGKYLEIFNTDGVIFLFKMFKYFAVIKFDRIEMLPVLRRSEACSCEMVIFNCFDVIPIFDAEHSLQEYIYIIYDI